jgi:branched-chain amino acid transport system ATP-binding protein
LADRAAVLVEGQERLVAPVAELLGDPRIAELYLGRHVQGATASASVPVASTQAAPAGVTARSAARTSPPRSAG